MTLYKKPRLKVPFQTKAKVDLNKNSKFWLFYQKRARFFKNRTGAYRLLLVIRNMKWTVARRYFGSRIRQIKRERFRYTTELQSKQQIKQFYGNLHDKQIIKYLRLAWHTRLKFSNTLCLRIFEARLDILLLRMRLLPSIFLCNQFILHQGVYVNNEKVYLPHYILKIGDILSFSQTIWLLLYKTLFYKLSNRYKGSIYLYRRRALYTRKQNQYLIRRIRKQKIFIIKYIENITISKRKLVYTIIPQFNKLVRQGLLDANVINLVKYRVNEICEFLQKTNISKKLRYLKNFKNYKRFKKKYLLMQIQLFLRLSFIVTKIVGLSNYLSNLQLYFIIQDILIILKERIKVYAIIQDDTKKKQTREVYEKYKKKFDILTDFFREPKKSKKFRFNSKFKTFKYQKYRQSLNKYERAHLIAPVTEHMYESLIAGLSGILNSNKFFSRYNIVYKKRKKRFNPKWTLDTYWYIPNYLEIDYRTLRLSIIANPKENEIQYPFHYSLYKLICFYKDYGYR